MRRTLLSLISAALAVLAIGYLDFLTGIEVRIVPLYFGPVSWIAWKLGPRYGLPLAGFSSLVFELSNKLAGLTYQHGWIGVWNVAAQFGAFSVVCILAWKLREEITLERELRRLDPLTGIYNSRAFMELASVELERARRRRAPLAVGFIDVDDFKNVNDRFGHSGGDGLLRNVAEVLKAKTRKTDILGRVGGDEFAVFLCDAGGSAARVAAESWCAAARSIGERGGMPVTLSVGVAAFEEAPGDMESALREADTAMYHSKARGKDGIEVVSPQISPGESSMGK